MINKAIITISRQYGSGGREIGKKLAELLQIPYYDNELITLAANKSGFGEELFEEADSKATNSLLYSLSMFGGSAGMDGLPLSDRIFLIQSDVIRTVAKQGPCVIVGRCADYVLREFPNCINVFIHADLEKRVARCVEEDQLPVAKAEDMILKKDKKRATYYNYYSGAKWGRVENYHLAIDSGSIGIDDTVALLKAYVEMREKN